MSQSTGRKVRYDAFENKRCDWQPKNQGEVNT
jgi:hypothetical protein